MKLDNGSWPAVWGAFLLRFSLGLLYLVAGLGKVIGGTAGFREYISGQFAKTWLPGFMVVPFGYVIPWAELALGVLLVLGLLRPVALVLGSLLMLALAFGMMVTQNWPTVAANLVYVALYAAALFTTRWDKLALDTLWPRKGND